MILIELAVEINYLTKNKYLSMKIFNFDSRDVKDRRASTHLIPLVFSREWLEPKELFTSINLVGIIFTVGNWISDNPAKDLLPTESVLSRSFK